MVSKGPSRSGDAANASSHSMRASPGSRAWDTRLPSLWTLNSWTSNDIRYHGAVPPPDFDLVAEARRNWERHGWDRPEAMAAATSIARAQQIVLARADAALAPFRLTFSRFEALALLFFSRRGALPMGKVGARLQVHPTSVTNTVDRLERDGLVRRASSDGDRRTRPRGDHGGGAAGGGGRRPERWPRRASGLADLDEGELRRIHDAILPLRRAAGDFEGAGRGLRAPLGLGRHLLPQQGAPTSWARRAASGRPRRPRRSSPSSGCATGGRAPRGRRRPASPRGLRRSRGSARG